MGIVLYLFLTVLYSFSNCEQTNRQKSTESPSFLRDNRNYEFGERLITEENRRPNYYHHSLPLPSPFTQKDSTIEKIDKPEKILHPPLYFTYNNDTEEDYASDLNDEATNKEDYEDFSDYDDYENEPENQKENVNSQFIENESDKYEEESENYGKEPEITEETYKKSGKYVEKPKKKISVIQRTFIPDGYLYERERNSELEQNEQELKHESTTTPSANYYFTDRYAKYAIDTLPLHRLTSEFEERKPQYSNRKLYERQKKSEEPYVNVKHKGKLQQNVREMDKESSKIIEDTVVAEDKKVKLII